MLPLEGDVAKAEAEPPDEVLVIAAILGDLEAFGVLASRYRAAVVRTAQAIVGREDAEDIAQDALLLAFKALPGIDDPTKFAQWLGVIARHRALRLLKREGQRRAASVDLDDVLLEQVAALSRPFVHEAEDDELRRALEEVPADYALVLRMRFLDEMPLDRIAAFVGVPLSTVKWRVHRGKALLREQIETLRLKGELWKKIEK
jgi:RNA polymerase sigma-70 factor (ECF subfamily)